VRSVVISTQPLNVLSTSRVAMDRANAEDAALWRWFALFVQESRIRWCYAQGCWLVSVDHKHLATECDFDQAIRDAKCAYETGQAERPPRRIACHAR
jgi:hypothetical protein